MINISYDYKLIKYTDDSKNLFWDFILKVPSLKNIDMTILENGTILYNQNANTTLGLISYEEFDDDALIRYFLFRKDAEASDLKILFESMKSDLENKKINRIISVVNNEFLETLFSDLGFINHDNTYFFIDEEKISTDNASIMIYNCKNIF